MIGPKLTWTDRLLDGLIALVPMWIGALVAAAIFASIWEACR